MPVFDFNRSSEEAKTEIECTYTVFYSNNSAPSAEQPNSCAG